MPVLDVEKLLEPIPGDDPCGADLQYDPTFGALMRKAETGEPVEIGSPGEPGYERKDPEEPSWPEVRRECLELFGQTKDLRLATVLTVAVLRMEGLPGLRDGLALIHGLLDRYWDHLHPKLDPDDNNDPTERLNTLAALAAPPGTFGDPWKFQHRLRSAPLAESRQLGRFSLREIEVANGDASDWPDGQPRPEQSVISGAFREMPQERLAELAEAATQSLELVKSLDGLLRDRAGGGPDLSGLRTMLSRIVAQFQPHLAGPEAAGEETPNGEAAPGGEGHAPAARLAGEVTSVRDALLALDKIVRYYDTHEPSSPVSLVVRCAQRLVSKKFEEITRILDPDAVRVLERISNPDGAES